MTKKGRDYYIHANPWHGSFSAYFRHPLKKARLEKIFFIRHASRNAAVRLDPSSAFKTIYPLTFPVFWDNAQVTRTIDFCRELTARVPCHSLGFVKDESVIRYVRGVR